MPCRVGGNTALVLRRKCQSLGTLVDAVDGEHEEGCPRSVGARSDAPRRDQREALSDTYRRRLRESNPERSDTLTLCGHSVFPRIAIKRTEPDLLLPYPAVPWNTPACPALWSLL